MAADAEAGNPDPFLVLSTYRSGQEYFEGALEAAEQALAVAEKAGVKKLALFHHDPEHTDSFLLELEEKWQKQYPDAFLAREGMEIEI